MKSCQFHKKYSIVQIVEAKTAYIQFEPVWGPLPRD